MNDARDGEVYRYMLANGCEKGQPIPRCIDIQPGNVSEDIFRMFYAALNNDVKVMKSLYIQGLPINSIDYEGRTALAIAASEGNLEAVKYLVVHGATIFINDSRGNNALDDAMMENRKQVVDYLLSIMEMSRL